MWRLAGAAEADTAAARSVDLRPDSCCLLCFDLLILGLLSLCGSIGNLPVIMLNC